jgi:hypothetical protein
MDVQSEVIVSAKHLKQAQSFSNTPCLEPALPMTQCYKTLYYHNLHLLIIS